MRKTSTTLMSAHMRAFGVGGIRKETYAANSAVAAREMRRASRFARVVRRLKQSGQSSPNCRPGVNAPQRAQGTSAKPAGNRIAELLRGGRASEISRSHVVGDDRALERIPEPPGRVQLTDVVEHERRGEHLRARIGESLPRDIRRASVDGLEDGGLRSDVAARRKPESAD